MSATTMALSGSESDSRSMELGGQYLRIERPEERCTADNSEKRHNLRTKKDGSENVRRGGRYSSRCSTYLVREVVNAMNENQIKAVESTGLKMLMHVKEFDINSNLTSWLVDNFDTKEKSLNVRGYRLKVTAIDVEYILGVKSWGIGLGDEGDVADFKLQRNLNIEVIGGEVGLAHLGRSLILLETSGTEFRIKFVLQVIRRFLHPSTEFGLDRFLIPGRCGVKDLGNINWGKYTLDGLVRAFEKRLAFGANEIGGCVVFLMVEVVVEQRPRENNVCAVMHKGT